MIEIDKHDTTSTIRIAGRFDFQCIKDFQPALAHHSAGWLVDLKAVEFLDSAALGMLLMLRDWAAGDNATVRIRLAAGQPREVLRMAKFDRLFALEE